MRPSNFRLIPKLVGVHLPKASGTYALVIHIDRGSLVSVGALGQQPFDRGWYIYCGSAMGAGGQGLRSRILRHLSKSKKKRWHIDHLLASEAARIHMVFFAKSRSNRECDLAKSLLRMNGSDVPVDGFGSSDCRSDCPAHLVRLHFRTSDEVEEALAEAFRKLQLRYRVLKS